MPLIPEARSLAVFCDFENVALGVREAKYSQFDMQKVLERLPADERQALTGAILATSWFPFAWLIALALFFLVTNLVLVNGLVLALDDGMWTRARSWARVHFWARAIAPRSHCTAVTTKRRSTSRPSWKSEPALKPALSPALTMNARAASAEPILGAKPPSSPTLVLWPAAFSAPFRLWKISAPIRIASRNVGLLTAKRSRSSTSFGSTAPSGRSPLKMRARR